MCYLIYLDLEEMRGGKTQQNNVKYRSEHKYHSVMDTDTEYSKNGSICDEHSLIFVSWTLETSRYHCSCYGVAFKLRRFFVNKRFSNVFRERNKDICNASPIMKMFKNKNKHMFEYVQLFPSNFTRFRHFKMRSY